MNDEEIFYYFVFSGMFVAFLINMYMVYGVIKHPMFHDDPITDILTHIFIYPLFGWVFVFMVVFEYLKISINHQIRNKK